MGGSGRLGHAFLEGHLPHTVPLSYVSHVVMPKQCCAQLSSDDWTALTRLDLTSKLHLTPDTLSALRQCVLSCCSGPPILTGGFCISLRSGDNDNPTQATLPLLLPSRAELRGAHTHTHEAPTTELGVVALPIGGHAYGTYSNRNSNSNSNSNSSSILMVIIIIIIRFT